MLCHSMTPFCFSFAIHCFASADQHHPCYTIAQHFNAKPSQNIPFITFPQLCSTFSYSAIASTAPMNCAFAFLSSPRNAFAPYIFASLCRSYALPSWALPLQHTAEPGFAIVLHLIALPLRFISMHYPRRAHLVKAMPPQYTAQLFHRNLYASMPSSSAASTVCALRTYAMASQT